MIDSSSNTGSCFVILAPYEPFKNFKYAGPLRAVYPLSPRRNVPESIQRPDYSETGIPKSEFMARGSEIKVLNEKEIEGVRKACTVSAKICL
jgi:methionyl aminopeptidase